MQALAARRKPRRVGRAPRGADSYSIPCALLFALTLATRGIRIGKGLGTAIVGLILFQSLTSVLAALTGLVWLMLEH